jgi:hypothetical protein
MKYLIVAITISLLATSTALAKGRCDDDRETFCKGVQKEQGLACLKEHMDKLSAACQEKVKEMEKSSPGTKAE